MEQNQSLSGDVDFSGLILGLSSSALAYLGISEAESDVAMTKNFVLAKQNIEIIRILKQKTIGNLTPEEENLIEQVLADLQMKFVVAIKT